ncbi:MAG: DUF3261 domain-containing protein [Methylophilus sp.]|uniref:DUF3261 domain-containing protein n=1 Tax=Methylophilus sp. TaxID=29541 RepID=UPI003F9FB851
MFKHVAILAIAILVAACSSTSSPRCTALPGNVQYCLQPTTQIPAFAEQQKVTVTLKQTQETLLTSVEVDASGVRMAMLSPLGQTLANIDMPNAGVIQVEQLGTHWDAKWLLALLQVTRWPASQVREGLSRNAEMHESTLQRDIILNGKVIMDVKFHSIEHPYQKLLVRFPALDMQMDIETLE